MSDNSSKQKLKKTIIEWIVIGSVCALLYFTGQHTEVLGTMQRLVLWTGIYNADISAIAFTDGPTLSDSQFRFGLETDDGRTIRLSNFKGSVIFLNVWASWCPPCIAEMPTIETLKKNVSGDEKIKFVLLTMDQDRQKAMQFMEDKKFELPYYFPTSGIPSVFRSSYLPTTYVISKEGKVVYKREGIADYSDLNFAAWLKELANR